MVSGFSGATQEYMNGLERIQDRLDTVVRQISSGSRVSRPSDDPGAIGSIYETTSRMAAAQQTATNIQQLQNELTTSDSALQQAVKLVDQAVSVGTQASSTLSATQTPGLIDAVQGILQNMVSLANTQINGRYVFSGDLETSPLYSYDAATGVTQLATATSTRAVTDGQGTTVWVPKTAQEIFDARDSGGNVTTGNVFSALQSLLDALKSQNTTAGAAAMDQLKAADDHLNQQLGFLGIAENRADDALKNAQSAQTSLSKDLSNLRDTDAASAAVALTQVTLQQQAAMSAGAKINQLSLFDYLR